MVNIVLFLILFFLFSPLYAQSIQDIQSTEHTKRDIQLRLLTWQGYAPKPQIEAFKAYIKQKYAKNLILKVSYVSSSDDYFEQIRRGNVDIIAPSHNIIWDSRYKLIKQRLIIPLNIENIPNYAAISQALKEKSQPNNRQPKQRQDVYFAPMLYGPYGMAYDASLFRQPPTSWLSFWDKSNTGQFSINEDYYEANIYITALASGLTYNEMTDIDKLNTPKIKQMLQQLVGQSKNLWTGVDTVNDLTGNKLATSWGFAFPKLNNVESHWKMACPKEGTTVWIDGHTLTRALADKPFLKQIAEEWINYSVSEQFQQEVVYQGLNSLPANGVVFQQLNAKKALPSHHTCLDLNFVWPILSQRQRNFMKSLWSNALRD